MKPLVVVTCIAVILATGWYGFSEWSDARDAAKKARIEAEVRSSSLRRDCKRDVTDWDAGRKDRIIARFGESVADRIISDCRYVLGE